MMEGGIDKNMEWWWRKEKNIYSDHDDDVDEDNDVDDLSNGMALWQFWIVSCYF